MACSREMYPLMRPCSHHQSSSVNHPVPFLPACPGGGFFLKKRKNKSENETYLKHQPRNQTLHLLIPQPKPPSLPLPLLLCPAFRARHAPPHAPCQHRDLHPPAALPPPLQHPDPAQQVPEAEVARALQGEVDAAVDEGVLGRGEGGGEGG